MASAVVQLNVGGRLFTTTLQTLTSHAGSYFAKRFTGDFNSTTLPDGAHFIDRDPQQFSAVLEYMRNGYCPLPVLKEDRLKLYIEADFYGLESLKAFIGGEALEMYSTILQRSSAAALDPEMKQAVNSLRYYAYGNIGEAWALTEAVGITFRRQASEDRKQIWYFTEPCDYFTSEGICPRQPAHLFSFSRQFNKQRSGGYDGAVTGYMVGQKSGEGQTSTRKVVSLPPNHPTDLESLWQHSLTTLPLSADDSRLVTLFQYLLSHRDAVLLQLKKFEGYTEVYMNYVTGISPSFSFIFRL